MAISAGETPWLRRMRPALGTYVEVAVAADVGGDAPAALEAAFAAVHQAQARWSFQDRASELSRLNAAPGSPVALSVDTCRLLRLARALMQASGGAFDPTLGGALVAQGALPDHGGPAPLPRGAVADLQVGRGWAMLRRPLRLTLDGIAKGWAVDLAVRAMRRAGARAGWVNAGGDMRAFGAVTLPVQRREEGRLRMLGGLHEMAVATSHVAPPGRTPDAAFPARLLGPAAAGHWTVLARQAWRADALTKVAACTPAAERAARVQRLGGRLLEAA